MSEHERPNPDVLLATLQKEEAKTKRGKLKVFFGMAKRWVKTSVARFACSWCQK
ncbi:MAG: hypothetical protein IH623_10055 [Verrucomicrobia bacterium]|nr:hypothetical protein [Verrucomicrobiota bacterium]